MHCPFLCRNLKKKGAKESHQSPSSSAHHQRNWLGELVFSCLETVPLDPNETPYYKKYTRNLSNNSRPVLPSWLIGPQQRKLKKNGINQVYNYVQSVNLIPLHQQGPQTEGEKYMDKKKEIQRAYRIIPPFSKQKKATKIGKDPNVDSFAYKKKNIQPFSKHTTQDKSEDSKSSSSSIPKDKKIKNIVRELRQINKKQPERLYYKPFSTYKIRQLRDKEAEYKHYHRYSNQRKINANLQELKLLQLCNSQICAKSNKNKQKSKAKHIEDNKRKNVMKMKKNNNKKEKEKNKEKNSARIEAPAKIKQSSSKTSQCAETKDKNSDEPTKSTHNILSVNKKKKRSKPKLFHLDIAVHPIKESKKKPRPKEKNVSHPAVQIPKSFPIKQNNKMKERKRSHLNRLAAQAARNYLIKKINGKHKTNIKNLDNTVIKVPKSHQTKGTNEKHKRKLDGTTGKRPKEKTNRMQRIFGNSLNYTDEELLRKLNHLRRLAKLNLANSAMKETDKTNEMNGEDATTELPVVYPLKGTNSKDETRVKYVGDGVSKLPTKTDNKMGKEKRTDRTDKVQFNETTTDQTKKIRIDNATTELPLKKVVKHVKKKKKIETNKGKVQINEHRYSTTIIPSSHSLKPDDRKSSRSSISSIISKELIKRQISQDRRMEPRYKEYLKKLNVYDNYTGTMPSNAISALSIATSGTSKSMALSNDSRSTAKLVHEPKYAISLYGPLPNIEADGSIKVSSVPKKKTLNVAEQGVYEFRNLSQFNPNLSKSKNRTMKRNLRKEPIYTTNEPVNSTEVPRLHVHQAKEEQKYEKSRSQLELHIRELLKIVETRDDLPVKKTPRNFVLEAQTKSWPTKRSNDRIKKPVKHKRFELCTKMEKIYVPGSSKPIFVRRYCRKPLPTPPPSELPDVEPAKPPYETCQTFDLSRTEDDPPLIREMKAAWNKIQLRNYYRFIIRRNERDSKGPTQCGNKCSHNHCSHIMCS
ncbi:PREDICTED: uncharacterized protein LOC108614995 [Drosophila arizonae]|uniref:Uncharacterized protein LOC108614995 n=1 Tax=Drosophila arizonae TaxID=7263 RepID=A0ABM1PBX5_DROAR|nr:PREDICTED: uncharacterized protein LOC108614995 [Drosophila arizonae]